MENICLREQTVGASAWEARAYDHFHASQTAMKNIRLREQPVGVAAWATRRIVGIDWSVPVWVFCEFCTSLGLMRAARTQMALRAFRLKLTMPLRGTLSA